MNSLTILGLLRALLLVSCALGFGAAVTLTTSRRILADPEQAPPGNRPIPPRRLLNRFGRRLHTLLLAAAVLALACVVSITLIGPA